jgi:hypothetical protein
VLIEGASDHAGMFGLFLLVFLLVVGPLAVVAGADSRADDVKRRRTLGR